LFFYYLVFLLLFIFLFFFNDTATTEIYTLSLHDALPISDERAFRPEDLDLRMGVLQVGANEPIADDVRRGQGFGRLWDDLLPVRDRKSTRLNSSHSQISYAVFCLKKKKKKKKQNNNKQTT